MPTVKNPILSGFYPDPSICRVGDTYYIVNSTFAYFPGVPIFASKDLCHFHQIGNILDRPSQLPLGNDGMSRGIFAPTIRYYDGIYYMITTNVSFGGNFIVTATDPAGPWSEPHYLKGAEGIDPSIFFDEDGKCYYIGTRPNPDGVRYNGDWYIYIQELDIKNFCLVGDYKLAWKGALRDAEWPEGPHLYKKDGWYYIMHAEGGTGPAHAVCVARSKEVFGPYVGNFNNPIFTHRHLGKAYPVRYVGHADLVDTPEGDWYMIMLASRPCEGYTGMGRETFLAKVTWEDGWPVVNEGSGKLADIQEVDLLVEDALPESDFYTFHNQTLDPHFVTVRNPKEDMYSLTRQAGKLALKAAPEVITEPTNASYLGVRQRSYHYTAETRMEFVPATGEEAGLVILQSERASVRFVVTQENGKSALCVVSYGDRLNGGRMQEDATENAVVLAKILLPPDSAGITLKIMQEGQQLSFWYAPQDKGFTKLPVTVDARFLSTEAAGGFVGNTIGMYASANHAESENYALFDYFAVTDL